MNIYTTYSTKKTSQSDPIPGKDMVKNSAGGFTFSIDDWQRLERFLILGTAGGTYYTSAKQLTKENADCVLSCIKIDGIRTVKIITDISHSGNAPKNDPALFALAMCTGLGDPLTKQAALMALPLVARIGTHLFHFATYAEQFRGWGRGLSSAIKAWYQDKSTDDLAYQAVKYQSRDGWSHRDMLRLAHPKTEDKEHNAIYRWIVSGKYEPSINNLIIAFEKAKEAIEPDITLITDYGLTREMVPTSWLNNVEVWGALLEKMPMTAMIRNLGKMSNVGLLKPMSKAVDKVVSKLNSENIKRARVHPLSILVALRIYQQGHGMKGSLTWDPISQIIDALNDAFYMAFQTVEPTGKRHLLALDVSGSMGWSSIAGMPITPREGSVAMAMVTAAKEKQYHIMGFSNRFIPLPISSNQRLDDAIAKVSGLPFEGTDCALPMMWAIENKVEVDAFIVYTDNETWAGSIHPVQALRQYREKMGIPAKLIVVGMTATDFSIADPDDSGMLDVVGFATDTPAIISNFVTSH